MFTAMYGPDWHEWESETLDHALAEIETDGGGHTSAENATKLMALQGLHGNTYAWVSLTAFSKTALALDTRIPNFDVMEPVHPGTLLCALSVMREIRPGYQLSHEVLRFIAVSCVDDGQLIFPDPEVGDSVNQVISRICSRSVSDMDMAVMSALWKRVAGSEGGVALFADRELDDVDESNLGDYQISMASRAAAYAMEFDAKKQAQLSSLAAWIKSAR
jgi:hypothetical protein